MSRVFSRNETPGERGYSLLASVWRGHRCNSWGGINHSMLIAVQLAIGAQLWFTAKDLDRINNLMRPLYWLGKDGFERLYAFAIAVGNKSFIEAFEEWKRRRPLMANNVMTIECRGYIHRHHSRRSRERLAKGSSFNIRFTASSDEERDRSNKFSGRWYVTSTGRDSLVACQYRNGAVVRRQFFTRALLKELCPAPKRKKSEASSIVDGSQ